jgi:uncharacterized protein
LGLTTPTARIVVDGKDITSRLLDSDRKKVLVSLTVTDEAGIKSDCAELVIDNRETFAAPPVGALMEVWMGYEPTPAYMGKFRVDEWTKSGKPNVLTVSAKSAELTTEIKGAKTRSWHDTTIGGIVGKIAGEHGLGSAVDKGIGASAVEHIDQQSESDLSFLSRMATRNGAMFKLADGKILFAKKGAKTLPSGADKGERTVKLTDDVSSWTMTKSERGGHKSVICYWHDHDAGKRKTVTSGSGKPVYRDKRVYRTQVEAQAAADAQIGDLQRGKSDGSLDLVGDPTFFAEMAVTLSGFDPDVDGKYTAKSVAHKFDSSGYTTSVSLEAGDSEADSSQ